MSSDWLSIQTHVNKIKTENHQQSTIHRGWMVPNTKASFRLPFTRYCLSALLCKEAKHKNKLNNIKEWTIFSLALLASLESGKELSWVVSSGLAPG